MDYTELTKYFVFVVVVACLVVGYIIKHATFLKWIQNDDIPVILAFVGLAMNLCVSGFSIESAVYGAVMGLASTGLHQGFKKFIEGNNSEKETE
ncbi:MAG: phage holin family protein [Lachnospiraceae bacterium]|nr:phage holin family protein [Lachnospiraceae bacterium]